MTPSESSCEFQTSFSVQNVFNPALNQGDSSPCLLLQAGMCTDPLEIYSFLFSQQIGCELAQFYEAWAWELERLGNTKKADLVYTKAIQSGAEPAERLRRRQKSVFMTVCNTVLCRVHRLTYFSCK